MYKSLDEYTLKWFFFMFTWVWLCGCEEKKKSNLLCIKTENAPTAQLFKLNKWAVIRVRMLVYTVHVYIDTCIVVFILMYLTD